MIEEGGAGSEVAGAPAQARIMGSDNSGAVAAAALAILLASPVVSTAAPPAPSDDYTIVPGKRIGRTYLGETRAAVRRTLGKPTECAPAEPLREYTGSRLEMDTWRTGVDGFYIVHVSYDKGRVVQISTDIPRFKTAAGISVKSALPELQRAFKQLEHYSFPSAADPEARTYTRYCDASAGIGFIDTNGAGWDFVTVYRPHYFIVKDDQ